MPGPLLSLFFAMCAVGIGLIIHSPRRFYEYPYAMTAVFAAFVGPQLYAISNHQDRIPPEAFDQLVVMSLLCLCACWVGYWPSPSTNLVRSLSNRLHPDRLFHGGLLLLAVGTLATILMHSEATAGVANKYGQWTGRVTIYHFFAQLTFPGLAIVLTRAISTRSLGAIVAAACGLVEPLLATIYRGRRETTVLTVLVFGLVLYFQKRVVPPRLLVVAALLAAAVMIPVTGQYRVYSQKHGLGAFLQFNPIDEFWEGIQNGQSSEMSMAANAIYESDRSGQLGLGAGYWNHIVFRFIPAQLVGMEVKRSLMLPAASIDLSSYYGVDTPHGTTITGLADTYIEFSYGGCLFFGVLGTWFRAVWAAAIRGGLLAQLLYMLTLTSGMRALTHWTYDFLPGLMYMAVFLVPVGWYAQLRPSETEQ